MQNTKNFFYNKVININQRENENFFEFNQFEIKNYYIYCCYIIE